MGDEDAQAGGVDEADVAHVDADLLGRRHAELPQVGVELRAGQQVDLAGHADNRSRFVAPKREVDTVRVLARADGADSATQLMDCCAAVRTLSSTAWVPP